MNTQIRTLPALVLLLLISIGTAPVWAADAPAEVRHPDHDRAVELARSGAYTEALALLAEMRTAAPDDLELLYDETAVLVWAGESRRAIANSGSIDAALAPDYVIDAVAKAYRNEAELEQAVGWYSMLLERDPANVEARLGVALSHTDAGDIAAAHRTLDAAPEALRNNSRILAEKGHLYVLEDRDVDALASYQRSLEFGPDNREALRGMALLLRKLVFPQEALALAEQHPGILTNAELIQLEADVAVVELRQGTNAVHGESRRYEKTDSALHRIEALLARDDIDAETRQRLEYDRIVGLTDRRRTAEAVAAFEAIDRPQEEIPLYVLDSAGTAYLEEHRPARARDILEDAVRRDPGNNDLKFRLFFAYSDLQQYDRARALAEGMLAGLEKTNQQPGSDVRKGSSEYLRAAILVGLAYAYADQLDEAQQYFEALLADLPHNTEVRKELANVYRWRGWPDRSLAQYEQILAVEPGYHDARVGATHTRLDARDYAEVERDVAALEAEHGFDAPVQNLAYRWHVHNRSELRLDARFGESSGVTFGDEEYQVDAAWYTKPLARKYRVLLRTHDAYASFPEGDARRRRAGAGVQYRYGRWQSEATVSAARDGGDAGVSISADYRLSDTLRFGGRIETESNDAPLRGYRVGVDGDLASFYANYAWHESRALSASVSVLDLADGNRVRAALLAGEQRLLNQPRFKLSVVADLYAAGRDREDVDYYSPRHDFSWAAGLRSNWSVFRRYRKALSQSLTIQGGRYKQAGFSAGSTWAADYRLNFTAADRWYTEVGVRRQRNLYDGTPEHATFFFVSFSGWF